MALASMVYGSNACICATMVENYFSIYKFNILAFNENIISKKDIDFSMKSKHFWNNFLVI